MLERFKVFRVVSRKFLNIPGPVVHFKRTMASMVAKQDDRDVVPVSVDLVDQVSGSPERFFRET